MPQGPEFIRCDYPNPLPDFERGDNETREALDACEMPTKVKFEHMVKHGSMVHGVSS